MKEREKAKKRRKKKTTAIITFTIRRLKIFSPRSGIRKGCLLLPFLFNIVLESLARAIRKIKERISIKNWKEVKLSVCR